jgi:hypothetical protein
MFATACIKIHRISFIPLRKLLLCAHRRLQLGFDHYIS